VQLQVRKRLEELKKVSEALSEQLNYIGIAFNLYEELLIRIRNINLSLGADFKRRNNLFIEGFNRLLEYRHEYNQEIEARIVADEDYRSVHLFMERLKKELENKTTKEGIVEGSNLINEIMNKLR